jgi:alanine-synthesizing transaminase
MFSRRLQWDLAPNMLSQLLRAKQAGGASVLDLTESNPTRAGFSYPAAEILPSLANPKSLLYEPQPSGLKDARAAVAHHHGLDVERVLLTTSTSESYAWLFKLLADPGDEVLVPRPSYPLFEFLAALESVRVVQYPLVYHDGWSLDCGALEHLVTKRTRAVILVNPNNPTGSFLKRHEVEPLKSICMEHGLAIISDEVFADYAFGPDPRRVPTLAEVDEVPTFCLSGLSKIAGLPQMKVGWIIIGGGAEALERLELIADTYLSIGTPVQHALPHLLAAGQGVQRQIAERIRENLNFLRSAVGTASACGVLDVEGGWCAILRIPRIRSEEEWCLEFLDRDNVFVQPGFFYDFETEAFVVVSLLTGVETFREGIERILARID